VDAVVSKLSVIMNPQVTYTLTVNINGQGSVDKNPNQSTYNHGDLVTLTARADTDWVFIKWSGDISSSTNPVQITMDGNKIITATFIKLEQQCYLPTIERP
jgi:hypothetical protein